MLIKKNQRFVIVSPHQSYGGSLVLHQLCKCLSEQGFDAKIFYIDRPPRKNEHYFKSFLRCLYCAVASAIKYMAVWLFKSMRIREYAGFLYTPVKGCKRKYFPIVGKDTIVVYPEIVYGNFLKGKRVVRWLLYHNPYKGYDAYGNNDLVIAFRDVFNDIVLNPNGRKITINTFDFDLYKQTNFGKRSGKCYIVRKGKIRKDLPDNFDGVIIDDLLEPEIVHVFNECEYCYSYDTQTLYSTIAAICGCISIVIPEEGKTREDYLDSNEKGWGIAYGESTEQIEFAIATRHKCIDRFKHLQEDNSKNVDEFIQMCEDYFG